MTVEQVWGNEIKRLYKDGLRQIDISKMLGISYSSVRDILVKAGMLVPHKREKENLLDGCISMAKEKELMDQAVTKSEIEKARSLIREGSIMNIKTDKAVSLGEEGERAKNGCVRRAVVVDASNKMFCRVQIEANGVTEDVMWSDICLAIRENAPYIGWRKKG